MLRHQRIIAGYNPLVNSLKGLRMGSLRFRKTGQPRGLEKGGFRGAANGDYRSLGSLGECDALEEAREPMIFQWVQR